MRAAAIIAALSADCLEADECDRTKQQIINEVWDDARIRGFLDKAPLGGRRESGLQRPSSTATKHGARSASKVFVDLFVRRGPRSRRRRRPSDVLETIAGHRHASALPRISIRRALRFQAPPGHPR